VLLPEKIFLSQSQEDIAMEIGDTVIFYVGLMGPLDSKLCRLVLWLIFGFLILNF